MSLSEIANVHLYRANTESLGFLESQEGADRMCNHSGSLGIFEIAGVKDVGREKI